MKTRRFLFLVLVMITAFSGFSLLAEEPRAELRGVDQKLSTLESKLNRLNEVHEQILEKQSEIDKELENLRIWIRRNRS